MKFRTTELFLGMFLSVAIFAMGMLFSSQYPRQLTQAQSSEKAQEPAGKKGDPKSFWEPLTTDPIAAFTLGLFLIGMAQAGFFFVQLRLIRESLGPAEQAARAAQAAAEHIPTVERAWVFCEPINIQQVGLDDYKFEVSVKNHGKTPAFLKSIWAHVRQDEPFDPVPTYAVQSPSQTSIILSAGEARTTDEIFQAGSQRIFYGYVRYTDIFNKVQVSRFCLRFAPEGHVAIAGHPNWSIHYTEKENG